MPLDYRIITCFFLATLLVAIVPGLGAPPTFPDLFSVRTVAVTPFTDEVGMHADLARWAAPRLTILLSGVGVRVVPMSQVEEALQATGLRSADLVSAPATENLAHQLQADVVVTGRLITADVDRDPMERGPAESTVIFALRLLVVPTRRLSYAEITGYAAGNTLGLVRAADQALRQFVSRWSMARP